MDFTSSNKDRQLDVSFSNFGLYVHIGSPCGCLSSDLAVTCLDGGFRRWQLRVSEKYVDRDIGASGLTGIQYNQDVAD